MPRPAAFLALALAGCSSATDSADEPGTPSITILEPADGATVCATSFHVVLEIENLILVDPYEPPDPLPEGSGHVDVMLDGQDVEMTQGEELDVAAASGFTHQLKAELSNADHTPIEPYAGDFIYIQAEDSACTP